MSRIKSKDTKPVRRTPLFKGFLRRRNAGAQIFQEMLPMPKTIISDASCLIVLTNIGELELLYKTYGRILTTPEIESEYGEALPEWIEIKSSTDKFINKF